MLLIAKRLARSRRALLPCAENMVDSTAYRPDDIITMMNGATVEVTNTDAEGRLIMADALTYACTKLEPTAIVDMATLTGGIVVALGSWCGGMFCGDESLRHRLELSADETEEKPGPCPCGNATETSCARHADLWNSGPKRDGHPIQGAAFLSHFVPETCLGHTWTSRESPEPKATPEFCEGPTGFGVVCWPIWPRVTPNLRLDPEDLPHVQFQPSARHVGHGDRVEVWRASTLRPLHT